MVARFLSSNNLCTQRSGADNIDLSQFGYKSKETEHKLLLLDRHCKDEIFVLITFP